MASLLSSSHGHSVLMVPLYQDAIAAVLASAALGAAALGLLGISAAQYREWAATTGYWSTT